MWRKKITVSASSLFQQRVLAYFEELYTFFEPFNAHGIDIDDDDRSLTFMLPDEQVVVLTPHEPTQQIWLASPASGGRYFSYDADKNLWQDTRTSESLPLFLWKELNFLCHLSLPFTAE